MIAPFVLDGPINKDAFETYVAQVLMPELRPGDIVIMDNLSSHKGLRVREMIEAANAGLLTSRPAAPISTRSRTPSPSSRLISEKPLSAPSRASGPQSAASSTPSRRPSAEATSLPPDKCNLSGFCSM